MNYRNVLLNFITEEKEALLENREDIGRPIEPLERAQELTHQILQTRFENELRQYRQDEEKAYDEFVARKNLDYLRIYIEEFLLLDKEESQIPFYNAVKKEMRSILNNLHYVMKYDIS